MRSANWPATAPDGRNKARSAATVDISVHHPGIDVVLELDQVVGRIAKYECAVHLHQPLEAGGKLSVHLDLALDAQMVHGLEVGRLTEGHAEMSRIEIQSRARLNGGFSQMAHQLVPEEVQGDP